MSRVLPHPLLSLALLLMWLMLTRFSLGHALLGGTVAVFAGWSMSALQPETPRFRRWDRIPGSSGSSGGTSCCRTWPSPG